MFTPVDRGTSSVVMKSPPKRAPISITTGPVRPQPDFRVGSRPIYANGPYSCDTRINQGLRCSSLRDAGCEWPVSTNRGGPVVRLSVTASTCDLPFQTRISTLYSGPSTYSSTSAELSRLSLSASSNASRIADTVFLSRKSRNAPTPAVARRLADHRKANFLHRRLGLGTTREGNGSR